MLRCSAIKMANLTRNMHKKVLCHVVSDTYLPCIMVKCLEIQCQSLVGSVVKVAANTTSRKYLSDYNVCKFLRVNLLIVTFCLLAHPFVNGPQAILRASTAFTSAQQHTLPHKPGT